MRLAFYLASLVVLAWSAFVVPLPAFIIAPSPATPVYLPETEVETGARNPALTVVGATDEITGALLLTTVSVVQATAAGGIVAWTDPFRDVQPRTTVIPAGVDEQEFFRTQQHVFEESVQVAAAVGLRQAGIEVTVEGEGARVEGVVPGGPAEAVLREGDVIVAVEGEEVRLASELANRTAEAPPGEVIDLRVRRDGEVRSVEVRIGPIPGTDQTGVGILVSTVDQRIVFPQGIEVSDRSEIGGPSAGLMMALTVYDLFDPADLTDGRVIAGTGTVDLEGEVGPIGGIQEKVRGALASGATIFLAPASQAEEARSAAPPGMEVIAVATVDDAIAALER